MTRHASLLTETDDDSFWKDQPSVVAEDAPDMPPRVFDLEDRTARFGEAVIDFAKLIPRGPLTDRLIEQLVGCGTSVGANYSEADDAISKKAFFLSINTCRRESREAKHFVRMVVRAVPELKDVARPLWQEAKELNLIFSKICRSK
jgi:four helix bundle protein